MPRFKTPPPAPVVCPAVIVGIDRQRVGCFVSPEVGADNSPAKARVESPAAGVTRNDKVAVPSSGGQDPTASIDENIVQDLRLSGQIRRGPAVSVEAAVQHAARTEARQQQAARGSAGPVDKARIPGGDDAVAGVDSHAVSVRVMTSENSGDNPVAAEAGIECPVRVVPHDGQLGRRSRIRVSGDNNPPQAVQGHVLGATCADLGHDDSVSTEARIQGTVAQIPHDGEVLAGIARDENSALGVDCDAARGVVSAGSQNVGTTLPPAPKPVSSVPSAL